MLRMRKVAEFPGSPSLVEIEAAVKTSFKAMKQKPSETQKYLGYFIFGQGELRSVCRQL